MRVTTRTPRLVLTSISYLNSSKPRVSESHFDFTALATPARFEFEVTWWSELVNWLYQSDPKQPLVSELSSCSGVNVILTIPWPLSYLQPKPHGRIYRLCHKGFDAYLFSEIWRGSHISTAAIIYSIKAVLWLGQKVLPVYIIGLLLRDTFFSKHLCILLMQLGRLNWFVRFVGGGIAATSSGATERWCSF